MRAYARPNREGGVSKPTCILLIEDNPDDTKLIQWMFQGVPGITLEWRERLDEALNFIQVDPPDVVLMDLGLPDAYGLQTMDAIRNLAAALPVVVLTGMEDERVAHLALEHGAQDYLAKDHINANSLMRSIGYAMNRHRRELALRSSEGRTRRLLEACPIGAAMADSEGRILEANKAFLDLLGWTQEDVASGNLTWKGLVPKADLESHLKTTEKVLTGISHGPWKAVFLRKDGSPVTVRLWVAPLEGPPFEFVAYAMDIREHKTSLEPGQDEAPRPVEKTGQDQVEP